MAAADGLSGRLGKGLLLFYPEQPQRANFRQPLVPARSRFLGSGKILNPFAKLDLQTLDSAKMGLWRN